MRYTLLLTSIMMLTHAVFADDAKQPEKNVPQKSRDEVLRRGDMVQPLGMTSAGEQDYIADALDPPEKDNQKFWVSVVTNGDDDPDCEHLKADILNKDTLRAWVKLGTPAEEKDSFFHLQYRDAKQRPANDQWFEGIEQYITAGKYPIIVLQPPENGEYGDPRTVINVIVGYKGDDKDLIRKIRNSIKFYIKRLLDKGEISPLVRGTPGIPLFPNKQPHQQEQLAEVFIGGHEQNSQPAATRPGTQNFPSPFGPVNTNDPAQPNPKFTFPDNTPLVDPPAPPPEQPATYDQMKTYIPEAQDDLIIRGIKAKWTLSKFAEEYDKLNAKVPSENFQSARHWAREALDVVNVMTLVTIAILLTLYMRTRGIEHQKFAVLDGLIRDYSTTNSSAVK